jgi:hypothetical protein
MNLFTVINVPCCQSHIFVLPFFSCVTCQTKENKMGVKETHDQTTDPSTWTITRTAANIVSSIIAP